MSTNKETPLGINITSSTLQNLGFHINPVAQSYMGTSKINSSYVPGKIINDTCLKQLTYAINHAYNNSASAGTVEWHTVSDSAWSSFMNSYAIWSGNNTEITSKVYYATVNFPSTGYYTFYMQADNYMNVILDYDTPISIGVDSFTTSVEVKMRIDSGNHDIAMAITNNTSGGPAGGALRILNSSGSEVWNSATGMPISVVNGSRVSTDNYNALISIGKGVIPSLGNSPPYTYTNNDPAKKWWGQATATYYLLEDPLEAQGQSQTATWIPYDLSNTNKSVTQWGYYRLFALQAWNEFNYNGEPDGSNMPEYKDFTSSFLSFDSFVNLTNSSINAFNQGPEFLKGIYSNMNDLISGDITGVSLATRTFGQDCITLGRAIDLTKLQTFGLPSVLLQTIKQNKILTDSLSLALLTSGLSINEINNIANGLVNPVSKAQEQKIYAAFLIILGQDLAEILFALNCKTQGLETLADLLNIKKLFPNSYQTLTVPIYNVNPGPTNSKTYYPIFDSNGVSPRLETPQVLEQVGEIIPPGPPPIIEITTTPVTPPLTEINNAVEIITGGSAGIGGSNVLLQETLDKLNLK